MPRKFILKEDRKINGIDSLSYMILEHDFPWSGDSEERARAHYERIDNHYVLFLGKRVIGIEHEKEEAEKKLYQAIKNIFNRTMNYDGDELEDRTSFFEQKEEASV